MFVHARVRAYIEMGWPVSVMVPAEGAGTYTYDGVSVTRASARDIADWLERYDVCMVHLLQVTPNPRTNGGLIYERLIRLRMPSLLFLHGVEILPFWKFRRDSAHFARPIGMARWLYHDFIRIPAMCSAIRDHLAVAGPIKVVTPSRWLRSAVIRIVGERVAESVVVIPNGVDTRRFSYRADSRRESSQVLAIRPLFRGGTYGVDLALKTFGGWADGPTLSLHGDGPDWRWVSRQVSSMKPSNVTLHRGFLQPSEIAQLHGKHSIYYAVTRHDTQGVSMCEAMASGLVVISFRLEAIPEFVEHRVTGLLIDPFDVLQARDAIQEVMEDGALRERLSVGGRVAMEAIDQMRMSELELGLCDEIARHAGG